MAPYTVTVEAVMLAIVMIAGLTLMTGLLWTEAIQSWLLWRNRKR